MIRILMFCLVCMLVHVYSCPFVQWTKLSPLSNPHHCCCCFQLWATFPPSSATSASLGAANRAYSAVGGVDLRMTMVSEKLKSAGYSTHQIGKWHAGSSSAANLPVNRGFDSSYVPLCHPLVLMTRLLRFLSTRRR